ncbi:hypothetical protein JGK52_03965 [Cytobacillus oceanisediminis]|uniref:hypothetical protein n=1 Tax=Cytobacillus oceanisediminis TaxID=665099 RepID=UPI001D154331|nr:hypothetical protein [Cytobacillus oceanisediminis]MCC3645841.1 hypothetical protein [Cytobacillus oceanisediminis]
MKWEYKTYTWNSAAIFNKEEDLVQDLNILGNQGWEVISASNLKFRCGETGTEQTDEVIYLLKRSVE